MLIVWSVLENSLRVVQGSRWPTGVQKQADEMEAQHRVGRRVQDSTFQRADYLVAHSAPIRYPR